MDFRKRAEELVSKMTLAEKANQMKNAAPAIERLGIPAYDWWSEVLHGVARNGVATVFPQAIGMAASFDEELLHKVATAISDETRAKYNEYKKFGETGMYQGLTCWSPNINIFRDPRWGRGHETYGEDPYLTGVMGCAFIKGLQGDGKYRKTDATIKHYAVHSGPEKIRHGFNAVVSEKDLFETYLWAFEYCIKNAHPSAVMSAYNAINGEPCTGSRYVLTELLRERLGFDGYVVSDCAAVGDLYRSHMVAKDPAESAAMAVKAGCELNCGVEYPSLTAAVGLGLIDEETITEAVTRLFTARFRLGMFDDDCEYDNIPYDVINCRAHRELNRKMAQDSLVLLKNNGILPLDPTKHKIAVIGPNSDALDVLLGNYNGTPQDYYTPLRGILQYTDNVIYAKGCHTYDVNYNVHKLGTNLKEAIIAAKCCDVIVMCMGLEPGLEGEQVDAYNPHLGGDKADLELPETQKVLYEEIVKMGKPIIYVNISGSCMNLARPKKECDAIIQCFYPGALGGLALADVIFGKVSPSGRLPVTFYESVKDLPDFTDYSMENRTYKFFKGTPVYPFGYGLTYSEIEEDWKDESTVVLTNKGSYDTGYSVLKFEYIPHKNLCGFKKVFLKAGESVTVSFK